MAHKKGQGSVRNGRDSVSKRLGVKEFGGQSSPPAASSSASAARNSSPAKTSAPGRDWTLFALVDGKVMFDKGSKRVNVVPAETANN